MSQQTNAQLKAAATVIKNETVAGANSQARMGGLLENMADSFLNKITEIKTKDASHTIDATDADCLIEMDVDTANNVTIPPDLTDFPVGKSLMICWYGTGQPTIVAGVGVTIRSESNYLKIAAQYVPVVLFKRAANEYYLWGALAE